jgi:hypothetical protein
MERSFHILVRIQLGLILLLTASALPVYAAAPPVVSLVVSVRDALVDENGDRLNGTDPSSDLFGIPVVEGDRVEIYLATGGQIFPPTPQGEPDARNQLIKTFSIGKGASPNETKPGKFGCVVSPRPAGGSLVFVRVFNAPDRSGASYYTDSNLFLVSGTVNEPFWASFPDAMLPLDVADDDSDGIINSREISIGTNPDLADSDGDGISDRDEMTAGTNPADGNSVFSVHQMSPASIDYLVLAWPTVTGRMYRIEHTSEPGDDAIYSTALEVRGNGQMMEVLLPRSESESALYRITTYMDGEPE